MLFSMIALFDLELKQLDMKTIFLHGELEEATYMHQSTGFIVEGKEDHVCQLKSYNSCVYILLAIFRCLFCLFFVLCE